jgi:two-component system, LytTR family, sensor kinase
MERERQRRLKLLLFMGFWTLLSVISAGQQYVGARLQGLESSWTGNLIYASIEWYSWALLTPSIIRLIDRYPLDRRRWRQGLLLHLPSSVIFPLLQLALHSSLWQWAAPATFKGPSMAEMFFTMFSRKFHICLLTYWAIVGAGHALRYYRNYRDEELHRSQLNEQLTRAQLDALKTQLHPHFLFNTLNTITALIRQDQRKAEQMIARLSDLLRLALDNEATKEVTLRQEMEFLDKYLEIEQTRFHDRLIIDRRIDQRSLNARVPNMILQPIVENAIRHGVARRAGAGLIRIMAERINGSLILRVRDDGHGVITNTDKAGVGIANTRARLERLYGADHRFELSNAVDGGAEVSIVIPFRAFDATSD